MKCSIVYLKPRSSYRPAMRSDTLWGAICWGMKMLYGENHLVNFINSYGAEGGSAQSVFLSSAFPYLKQGGERELYLPRPLLRLLPEEFAKGSTFRETIKLSRANKQSQPRPLMSRSDFEKQQWEAEEKPKHQAYPKVSVDPMTHNTINRITGSTLKTNDGGQLFHTEERHVLPAFPEGGQQNRKNVEAGLYFLAKGDIDTLAAVLRLLEHYGIGGDRSSGKGRFEIELAEEQIEIKEPADANAQVALSLYHPTQEELGSYQNAPGDSPLQYKTVVRQGWKAASPKKPTLYFEEGSVFPLLDKQKANLLGCNANGGTHEASHQITQYGYGFMINVKVPTS